MKNFVYAENQRYFLIAKTLPFFDCTNSKLYFFIGMHDGKVYRSFFFRG